MFGILRRAPQPDALEDTVQDRTGGRNAPVLRESRLETEVVESLEADVLKAIEGVTRAIAVAAADVAAVEKDLAEIRTHAGELASSGKSTSAESLSLASSTEELAVTSAEIGRSMEHASTRIDNAIQAAQKASELIMQLSAATAEIVGIVDTISAVARQTNLLALNATIEAARAGVAGRGFAVVASEVKVLSTQTGQAADDIRQRIDRLRETAQASTGAVTEVVDAVQGVRPVFDTVRNAVGEQNAAISEVSRLAQRDVLQRRQGERARGRRECHLSRRERPGPTRPIRRPAGRTGWPRLSASASSRSSARARSATGAGRTASLSTGRRRSGSPSAAFPPG